MTFLELAKKRFSVRKFKPDPVKEEDLQYVLEAGRIAPSANNSQPWQFIVVIKDGANNNKVNELYHREWYNDAPVVIIIVADQVNRGIVVMGKTMLILMWPLQQIT